ncbi:MAG: DUF1641 domain-containing protein [Bacteroidales bacterium]|nr:DUF1641 domain-containing protein [Bacteroidales bacterium]
MDEKSLQEQINALNGKMDLLLEYVNQQRLQSSKMEDLVSDLSIVGKSIYQYAESELENRMVEINPDEIMSLGLRLLRNIQNINRFLETFESMMDFLKDAGPVANEMIITYTQKLHEFDQKGYFEFFAESTRILDNVVSHYKPEDVKSLADNIVTIIETVRSLTQPEMMTAVNNAVKVFGSMEYEKTPEYSIWKLMRELNQPEMKRALGFMVTFMKNLSNNKSL